MSETRLSVFRHVATIVKRDVGYFQKRKNRETLSGHVKIILPGDIPQRWEAKTKSCM